MSFWDFQDIRSRHNNKASSHHRIHEDKHSCLGLWSVYAITQGGSRPEAQVQSQGSPCRIFYGTGVGFFPSISIFHCWLLSFHQCSIFSSVRVWYTWRIWDRSSKLLILTPSQNKSKCKFPPMNGSFSTRKQKLDANLTNNHFLFLYNCSVLDVVVGSPDADKINAEHFDCST